MGPLCETLLSESPLHPDGLDSLADSRVVPRFAALGHTDTSALNLDIQTVPPAQSAGTANGPRPVGRGPLP
ncbi:hypothetical protein GCM10010417_04570 [Streptomyces carpaticus]